MTDTPVNLANMEVTAPNGVPSGVGMVSNSIQKSPDKQGVARDFSKSLKQQKQSTEQSSKVSTAGASRGSRQWERTVNKSDPGNKVSATGKNLPPTGNGKPLHAPAALGEQFGALLFGDEQATNSIISGSRLSAIQIINDQDATFQTQPSASTDHIESVIADTTLISLVNEEGVTPITGKLPGLADGMAVGQVIPGQAETVLNGQPTHTFEENKSPVNPNPAALNRYQSGGGGMESKISIPDDTPTGYAQTGKTDSVTQPNAENGTRAGDGLSLLGATFKVVSETRRVPPRMAEVSRSVADKALLGVSSVLVGERFKPVVTKLNTGSTIAFNQLLGELETEQSMPKEMDALGLRVAAPRSNSLSGFVTPNNLQLFTSPNHPAWSQELGQKVTWLVQQDLQQAKLQINPKHLGPLDVKITVGQDQQVNVSFTASSVTVKEAIDQAIPRLREMFEQQGLDLADVNVSDQSKQHAREGSNESRQVPVTDGESGGDESTHDPLSIQGLTVSQALDGRIDLFA